MKWKLSDLIPQVSVENLFQFFPLNALGNLIKEPFSRLSAVQNIADKIGEGFTKALFSFLFKYCNCFDLVWIIYLWLLFTFKKKRFVVSLLKLS